MKRKNIFEGVAYPLEGEKLTLNAHKEIDWVTVGAGITFIVCAIGVVLSAIMLDIQLK